MAIRFGFENVGRMNHPIAHVFRPQKHRAGVIACRPEERDLLFP